MATQKKSTKSWKQKKKAIEELQNKELEIKQKIEKEFLHILNRVKNAVYILIIIIIVGLFLTFPYIPAMILFIVSGIVILFLIYWPVGKEIEKLKQGEQNIRR
ncbi:MAG: hypothetical protein ACTSWR_03800 [Candidatus Helarchaeota archaeon]